MTALRLKLSIVFLALVVSVTSGAAQTPEISTQPFGHTLKLPEVAGAYGPAEGRWRRQYWAVPGPSGALLRGVVFRPRGEGPFPLAIISHGTSQGAAERAKYTLPFAVPAMEWLVEQGFMVAMVQRRGVGETKTPFMEQLFGICAQRKPTDYLKSIAFAAEDIQALISEMQRQPFTAKGKIVLVGHSGGGIASLSRAASSPDDVLAVLNFGGGRGGNPGKDICNEGALVGAFGAVGRSVKAPTLWVYAENDAFFNAQQVQRFRDAFVSSGGKSELVMTPAFGDDGHNLVNRREGRPLWQPAADAFMKMLAR